MPFFDVTVAVAYDPADVGPAILEAVAEAVAAGGGVVYFPPGEHVVGETVEVADAHCVRFLGEGRSSVLRRTRREFPDEDLSGILRFERCTGIVIERLALDANSFQPPEGSNQRALVQFDVSAEHINVQDVRAFDGAPEDPGADDFTAISHRYDTSHHVAFGFWSPNASGCRDITITRCRLETLGIAVHGASRVRIVDNEIIGPIGHGIAVGAGMNAQSNEDVWIQGNRIAEPRRFGIVAADIPPTPEAGFEPPAMMPGPLKRIRIERNSVTKSLALWARGIVVGLLDHRSGSEAFTTLYEDIFVSDNRVDLSTTEPRFGSLGEGSSPAEESRRVAGVWLQAQPSQPPDRPPTSAFRHARVTGNVIRGARRDEGGGGAGVVAWNLRESEVGGNGIYGADHGVVLAGELLGTHLHDNRAEARERPFRYGTSLGRNTFGSNATLDFASQETFWAWEGTAESDRFNGGDDRLAGQQLFGRGFA